MNSIALVAFESRYPSFIFVKDPSLRGRYLRTDRSVIRAACSLCGAFIGEPCFSKREGFKVYHATTHYVRRNLAKRTDDPGLLSETEFLDGLADRKEIIDVVGEIRATSIAQCIQESFKVYNGSPSQIFERYSEG